MLTRCQKTSAAFMVFLFMFAVNVGSSDAGAVLADLENELMCKCDDKCGKVLINCTCSTAAKTRKKFTKMLESGITVEQIIQQQVEEYGETVLSAPTKAGFNLTAWVMPFGALFIGVLGLRSLLNTWSKNNMSEAELLDSQISDTGNKDKSSDASSSKFSRDLQKELERLET